MEKKVFLLRCNQGSTIAELRWFLSSTKCPNRWMVLKISHMCFLGITCNSYHPKIHDVAQECHTLVIHDNFKRPSIAVLFVVLDLYRPLARILCLLYISKNMPLG